MPLLTETEPNNRPDQALAVSQSAFVSASLSADPREPDEDWYALVVPSAQVVDLSVSGIPGADVQLEVMDSAGNRLALVNGAGDGKEERIPNLGVIGTVLVRVTGAKHGAGGAYTLAATFRATAPGAELEPNDRAADANAALLGQPMSGFLAHAGDQDWYRYELPLGSGRADDAGPALELDAGAPAQTALRVELSKVAPVRLELAVLSAAEAVLFSTKGSAGESLSLRNVGVRAADRTVYVVVKSALIGSGKEARRGSSADQAYVLAVSVEESAANSEYEPNDEPAKATPLSENGYRDGFLTPSSDVDCYALTPSVPSLVRATLSGVERLDLALSLIKAGSDGAPDEVVLRANDGAVKEPEQLASVYCERECVFKVEGAARKVNGRWVRDLENAEVPYRLTVSTRPDDGHEEREPNNAAESSTPMAMATPVRGTIFPKGDRDFFALDLSGRPVRTPLRATVTGILKVDIAVYLYRVGDDGRATLAQTSDRAKGDSPEVIRYSAEPGRYVLEVRDSKSRESNFQDAYQLTVDEAD